MTPDKALNELLAGNQRFVQGHATAMNSIEDRAQLAAGQTPIAAMIRCADSRVAPEIVFDQPLGKLFVCGVAGNIPTAEIVVMGHSQCGAVAAAMQNEVVEGVFAQVALAPTPDLDDCIAHNAEQGINTILNRSYMIEEAVKNGSVQIVAGVQDIVSGEFELVAQTQLNH